MKIAGYIVGIILAGCMVYSVYWVFKTVSYSLFYENMVENTIGERVKPECLTLKRD